MALLAGCILLMSANWLLEASKWKLLVQKNEPVTFTNSVKAILSGVALSIVTPNQLGDFAGRVIHLRKLDKIKGTLITVIGHTAQVIMTAAFGLYSLIWFARERSVISEVNADVAYVILFILVVLTLIAYLHIKWIAKIPVGQKLKPYLEVFERYTRNELVEVLMLSFLRYVIFLAQYVLLLHFFEVDITLEQSLACVIAALCIQSFVPSFILIEIGVRGATAIWLFGMFTTNITGVLLSVYLLWIINLMLPALAGLLVIMKWRADK